MTSTKTWQDVDHPYYMTEGCYFVRGTEWDKVHADYESWADFIENWGDADDDYNLVFRWDYKRASEDDERETDEVHIFFIMQRKGFPFSTVTKVTPEDESSIFSYLKDKAAHMAKLWDPFLKEN